MMEPLKPCPFCGGKGTIIENMGRKDPEIKAFHTACNNPKCALYDGLRWYDTEDKAITAWNLRVEPIPDKQPRRLEWADNPATP